MFAALIALWLTGAVTVDVEQNGGERPEAGREDEPSGESPAAASEAEIRALIARLDAGRFASREQATRELLTCGKQAVPYLVEALGDDSSEVCFRARALLSDHQAFEDVALPLAGAVESPRRFRAARSSASGRRSTWNRPCSGHTPNNCCCSGAPPGKRTACRRGPSWPMPTAARK